MQTVFTKTLNKTLQYDICKSEELQDSVEAGYSLFSQIFLSLFYLFIFLLLKDWTVK